MTTTPNTTTTDAPPTPEQLLVDLGKLHTRTCVSPLPKHPAAMGWQATAGSMAAGFARALHALNELDPGKAAEITEWFQGPFEEGPDPEEHTDWLERHVARGPELLEQWVDDGRRMAREALKHTEAREKENQASEAGGITAAELAHALDNSTPYPIELDRELCRFMAERLLEMTAVSKRPKHDVWQSDEEPPGVQPEPIGPATLGDRLRCPQCGDDLTDYDEGDFVHRTGDDRPYCSGECVVAAHRAGQAGEQE